MESGSRHELKTIYFEGEMLPDWAQLLDVAARLCATEATVQDWFALFTHGNGVADATTVLEYAGILRQRLLERREAVEQELAREPLDGQPAQIIAAWLYALDTMIQQATGRATCRWRTEDAPAGGDDFGEGEIRLRRV